MAGGCGERGWAVVEYQYTDRSIAALQMHIIFAILLQTKFIKP